MKKIRIILLFFAASALYAGEWKDIPYYEKTFPVRGDGEALRTFCKLDLKTPETKNFPTLVWFHGGGLSRGSRFLPREIDTKKIAVVSVDYRLSGPKVSHPDYIFDAAAAVSWTLGNIRKYGGDPKKVFVSGHSAGAYLSAMIALDRRYLNSFGRSPAELAGVYPVSGQMTTHFQILAERRRSDPRVRDLVIDEYAPLYHASADAPPMILFCGDPKLDIPSRAEENRLLAARLTRVYKHKAVKFVSIPQTGHGTCLSPCLAMISEILSKL
ncbi:MAG: alpha/beta fold hydrolase [Lentisphaeria bacterium]|nr:alpha/beta fold hydrolase [Lentisphaeria bacterium]